MIKVLVIEDSRFLQEETRNLLALEGFDVIVAGNGEMGLELARTGAPDIIICDVTMPIKSGYDVLSEARADPVLRSIPFILLTSHSKREDMRKGMELGADDYITKPFSSYELVASIHTNLKKHQAIDEEYVARIAHLQRTIAYAMPEEIREPLNDILGYARALYTTCDQINANDVTRIAHHIDETANKMHRMTENYLAFINIAILASDPVRKESLRQQVVSGPCEVIKSAAELKAYRAERWSDIDLQCENAAIRVSRDHLERITSELFDNALKFSQPGTPVRIRTVLTDTTFSIETTNQGNVVPLEVIELVKTRPASDDFQARHVHSGSGLWIVRWLIDLHEGTIEIDEAYGAGARITVTFNREFDPA